MGSVYWDIGGIHYRISDHDKSSGYDKISTNSMYVINSDELLNHLKK